MNERFFKQLLTELDAAAAVPHSTINHHVEGLDYLCLHRTDALTAKLYFIDPARTGKLPGAMLVAPHSHRYAFHTIVLAGEIRHERYHVERPLYCAWERWSYKAETRAMHNEEDCELALRSGRVHEAGDYVRESYWVEPDEVHTLIVPAKPVMLGLVQFADTRTQSDVYIPTHKNGELHFADSRRPTVEEVETMRARALQALETRTLCN
jgi:hypothetical protein